LDAGDGGLRIAHPVLCDPGRDKDAEDHSGGGCGHSGDDSREGEGFGAGDAGP
jgi:hypothetical protein